MLCLLLSMLWLLFVIGPFSGQMRRLLRLGCEGRFRLLNVFART